MATESPNVSGHFSDSEKASSQAGEGGPAAAQTSRRLTHGVIFVLCLATTFLFPALRDWPWVWVAPLIAYAAVVACVPRLRCSWDWLRFGHLSAANVVATLVVMLATIVTLIGFHALVEPDVRSFRAALPLDRIGNLLLAGIIFTIANATLEELVFRGVIFDALHSQWGIWMTLTATALLFGLGHLRGYPPGLMGAGLATLFGFAMGVLRWWSRGLALPILVHMAADATIYAILAREGPV